MVDQRVNSGARVTSCFLGFPIPGHQGVDGISRFLRLDEDISDVLLGVDLVVKAGRDDGLKDGQRFAAFVVTFPPKIEQRSSCMGLGLPEGSLKSDGGVKSEGGVNPLWIVEVVNIMVYGHFGNLSGGENIPVNAFLL